MHGLLLAVVEWSSAATAVGTAIVVIATTMLTLRTNIATHWKGTSEALEKHLEIAMQEKAAAEAQLNEQRLLKHDALTEIAALRAKTDLEPVIRLLADVQKRQVERTQREHENDQHLTSTLEAMERVLQELSSGMRDLLTRMNEGPVSRPPEISDRPRP